MTLPVPGSRFGVLPETTEEGHEPAPGTPSAPVLVFATAPGAAWPG
jgi:hypothetical protein